jgi:hypothetical protein
MDSITKAVIKQLGYQSLSDDCKDTLQNVANCGADAGFPGFIYYTDTVDFFDKNRDSIIQLVEEMADSLGEEPFSMIASFNCLKDLNLKTAVIAKTLYGRGDFEDSTAIKNALSWFALEEIARRYDH